VFQGQQTSPAGCKSLNYNQQIRREKKGKERKEEKTIFTQISAPCKGRLYIDTRIGVYNASHRDRLKPIGLEMKVVGGGICIFKIEKREKRKGKRRRAPESKKRIKKL
jgi:hypothetical protein